MGALLSRLFSIGRRLFGSTKMLGGHSVSNPPKLDPKCGAGSVEEFAGLKTYFTGPRDSRRAILLCHDAFGYQVPNLRYTEAYRLVKPHTSMKITFEMNRLFELCHCSERIDTIGMKRRLADKIADKGYLVVVPDFFYGEPCDLSKSGFDVEVWFNNHHPIWGFQRKGAEDAIKVVIAMKKLGVKTIGAAGFCWGGLPVVRLCSDPDLIQAGVVFHPVALTEDDMRAVKVPLAVCGPEVDEFFPVEELQRLVKVLKEENKAEWCHKIYPGTKHGWTTRYDEGDETARKMAEEAHRDLLE